MRRLLLSLFAIATLVWLGEAGGKLVAGTRSVQTTNEEIWTSILRSFEDTYANLANISAENPLLNFRLLKNLNEFSGQLNSRLSDFATKVLPKHCRLAATRGRFVNGFYMKGMRSMRGSDKSLWETIMKTLRDGTANMTRLSKDPAVNARLADSFADLNRKLNDGVTRLVAQVCRRYEPMWSISPKQQPLDVLTQLGDLIEKFDEGRPFDLAADNRRRNTAVDDADATNDIGDDFEENERN